MPDLSETPETGPQKQDPAPAPDIYSEAAVWLCENRKTRFKTRINGALAQILKQYPSDYKLKLLSIKEPPHEHSSATG
jgi:hypothetical protein